MEAGADLQQAADAALDLDLAAGGGGDAGEDLEQGAFPAPGRSMVPRISASRTWMR